MKTMKMTVILTAAIGALFMVSCTGVASPVARFAGNSVPVDRFGNPQMIIRDYQQLFQENTTVETEFPEFNYRYKQSQLTPFFNLPLLNMANNTKNNEGKQIIPKLYLNHDASITVFQNDFGRGIIIPMTGSRIPN